MIKNRQFQLLVKFGSGYEKWKCIKCGQRIIIPANRINRTIWCNVCNNVEERPNRCPYCHK